MNRLFRHTTAVVVLATAATAARAQQTPSICYVYPAGAQQGRTVTLTIGGQRLLNAEAVQVSGEGVQIGEIEISRPPNQKQIMELRNTLRDLTRKRDRAGRKRGGARLSAEDRQQFMETVESIAAFERRREAPAFGERVTVEITLAADAPVGRRELRVQTPQGLSNPMVFCVGSLAETSEPTAAPSDVLAATGAERLARLREWVAPSEDDTQITLPAMLNGQIIPGDVDRYRFTARRGQTLVVSVAAREIIPYLADAVPGWFDAVVTLYNTKGEQLACTDHDRFRPDPTLRFDIPADGQYALEIRDALYRGREDFVYRVAVGELPLVTGIFPLGGPAETRTFVQLRGWNLREKARTMTGGAVQTVAAQAQESWGQGAMFSPDTLPEFIEPPATGQPRGPQEVTLPVIANGRIAIVGEWDVYSFQGRKGQQIVAEVQARRLGSPLDSMLKITDVAGEVLASNDDCKDLAAGLVTHHADSCLSVSLPADGTYYVQLGDTQGKAGEAYAYRLRISEPQPDFELRLTPSAVNVRPGATAAVTAHAIRRDGFDGEITLSLRDAPDGFRLSGGRIPAGENEVRLTLSAPARRLDEPVVLNVEGRATIAGRDVVRPAVAAEDMMQAFGLQHLVPIGELKVCQTGRPLPRAIGKILSRSPLRLPVGGTAGVRVELPDKVPMGDVRMDLNEPPDGVTLERVASSRGDSTLLIHAAETMEAGTEGNLIVNVFLEPKRGDGEKKNRANRKIPFGTLPAIPYQIVAR